MRILSPYEKEMRFTNHFLGSHARAQNQASCCYASPPGDATRVPPEKARNISPSEDRELRASSRDYEYQVSPSSVEANEMFQVQRELRDLDRRDHGRGPPRQARGRGARQADGAASLQRAGLALTQFAQRVAQSGRPRSFGQATAKQACVVASGGATSPAATASTKIAARIATGAAPYT